MPLVIAGFGDNIKVPGFYGETLYGQSAIKLGSITRKLLIVGLKHTTLGSITTNAEVVAISSKEDADTYLGAGGECARMAYAALDEAKGLGVLSLYACCPAPLGGAVAATCIATFSGTSTAAGTIYFWIGGDRVEVSVASGLTATQVGVLVQTASNQFPRLAAAVTNVLTGAVTWTVGSAGIRGNDHILYVDVALCPGITVVLSGAGGAAVTSSTTLLGRKFGGGTGTETLTTMLAVEFPMKHTFKAIAQNDATSLAAWETQCDAKAGPLEGRMEHYMVASNLAFAATTSLAQTTLNNARFNMQWLEISERHPSELAAAFAALRCVTEGQTPNSSYDDYPLRVATPQRFPADWVTSLAEKQAALDVGVTTLETRADGKVYVVRAITTKCLNGATPDYRTIDVADSFVPDYARERIGTVWTSEYRVANPYVRPNPVAGEADVPEGVATPDTWNNRVYQEEIAMEREKILVQVALNKPSSEFNSTANRIMTAMPIIPLSANHQVGVSARQLSIT